MEGKDVMPGEETMLGGDTIRPIAPVTLEVRGLVARVAGRSIVDDIGFRASGGGLIALVGPNGVGKTTLIKAVLGLIPGRGRVTVDGVDLAAVSRRERARLVSYLPQGHETYWPLPVRDIVALGRLPHGGDSGGDAVVEQAMAFASVGDLADRPVTRLSGGERARVALARAFAVDAPVLLVDEPIASLDPRYQLMMMEKLRALAESGRVVVAVLHDLALVTRFATRALVMQDGRIVADGAPDTVLDDAVLAGVFGIEGLRAKVGDNPYLLPWRAL